MTSSMKKTSARDGDEVVHASGFMVQDNRFTPVSARPIPFVGWFKGVVHHQAKRTFVEEARVQHLSVSWFKDAEFLDFTWKENHR